MVRAGDPGWGGWEGTGGGRVLGVGGYRREAWAPASASTAIRKEAGCLSPASLSEPLVRLLAQQSPLKLTTLLTALAPCRLRLLRRLRRRRHRRLRKRCSSSGGRRRPLGFVATVLRAHAQPLPSGRFHPVRDLLLLSLIVSMQCDTAGQGSDLFVPLDLVTV